MKVKQIVPWLFEFKEAGERKKKFYTRTRNNITPHIYTSFSQGLILALWPLGCITCIVTLPCIALLALSISIELVSSSARVTSVKFQQGLRVIL